MFLIVVGRTSKRRVEKGRWVSQLWDELLVI